MTVTPYLLQCCTYFSFLCLCFVSTPHLTVSPLWVLWEFLCWWHAVGKGRKMNQGHIIGGCPLCKWSLTWAISTELCQWLMEALWSWGQTCPSFSDNLVADISHWGSGKGGFRTLLRWSISDFNDSSLWNRSNKDVGEKEGKQTLSQRYQSV